MVRFGRGCFVRHFGRILWAAVGGKGLWNMFLFAFGTCLSIVRNLLVLQHILAGFCGLGFLLRTIFSGSGQRLVVRFCGRCFCILLVRACFFVMLLLSCSTHLGGSLWMGIGGQVLPRIRRLLVGFFGRCFCILLARACFGL